MRSLLSGEIADVLDRKYEFVCESSLGEFFLDAVAFVDWLVADAFIAPFSEKMLAGFLKARQTHEERLERQVAEAEAVRDDFIALYGRAPDLGGSGADLGVAQQPTADAGRASTEIEVDGGSLDRAGTGVSPNPIERRWDDFDALLKSERRVPPLSADPADGIPDSYADRIVWAAEGVLSAYESRNFENVAKRELDPGLRERYDRLSFERQTARTEWLATLRTSPGFALEELRLVFEELYPRPVVRTWPDEIERSREHVREVLRSQRLRWVRQYTLEFSEERPRGIDRESVKARRAWVERKLRRIYEGVRSEIGTALLHETVLNRYKVRSQWYNAAELRRVVERDREEAKRRAQPEHVLTLDLARYLYDQGLDVIYRLTAGQHEFDLIEMGLRAPLLIEVKVYRDDARAEIIDAYYQAHAYLCNYAGVNPISAAYVIVFRLGGAIYELPEIVSTARYSIRHLFVDIGEAAESGRRQAEPIQIPVTEILRVLEA